MGDIGDSLFGEAPEASTEQMATMTPEQQEFLKKLLARFTGQLGDATTTTKYDGPFAEPLTNLQKLSLEAIENMSLEMGSSGTYMAAQEALTNQLMTGGKQDITDTFTNSVVNPYLRRFEDEVIPQLFGNFAGTGAYGSDKMKQSQLAMTRLNEDVLNAGSTLSFTAGNEANKNKLAALGLTEKILGIPLNAAITGLNAGGIEQATGQKAIDNELEYIKTLNANRGNTLQAMIAALGLKPFENVTTVSGGSSGIMGPAIQAFGSYAGSTAGSQALTSFFSDRRLKRAITKIGEHKLGIGIYLYNMLGQWIVGVMADEVQRVKPEAVTQHKSGFLQVDYGMLN